MLKRSPQQARRGIILMVVLMLITLFAIIGVSFVLYADNEASSARLDRETHSLTRPDLDPQQALGLVLGQVLYGVDDENGVYSGLRGHDIVRGVYGNNSYYDATTNTYYALGNTAPFTANGRLHYTYPKPAMGYPIPPWLNSLNVDNWQLINYTYFPTDGFLRDPERYGVRFGTRTAGSSDTRTDYLAEFAVPYTYPDHNNFALAVIRASDGAVLAQSFHRPWMGFGSLDPLSGFNAMTKDTNWTRPSTSDPTLKYKVLRPRPAEHPNFPLPEDAGGDVKNFLGGPGYWDPVAGKFCNNDSFWIDPGLPPQTGPDGKMFKIMAAMLIVDMGGRVDVNAHGNLLAGRNNSNFWDHRSNHGLGAWEVSLKPVLNFNTTEWQNVFVGRRNASGATEVLGKYGFNPNSLTNPTPTPPGTAVSGNTPHFYSQVDFDAVDNSAMAGTDPATPSWSTTLAGTAAFPTYPGGYQNGNTTERTNHSAIYNATRPQPLPWTVVAMDPMNPTKANSAYNLRFPASDLERLLRFGDTDGPSLSSQLERLCVSNFNNTTEAATAPNLAPPAKRRLLVTTDSSDRNAPGVFPYIYKSNTTPAFADYSGTGGVPSGPTIPFPSIPATTPGALPSATISGTSPTEFGIDWRAAVTTTLRRINLNRQLTQYPLYPAGGNQTQNTYAVRFDDATGMAAQGLNAAQWTQALLDRQNFANDVYRTLLAVTGVPPASATPPSDADLAPRRWLAQLAVNIVDFIDEDDISTPFNFYSAEDGLSPANIGDLSNDATLKAAGVPRYWVFGTELPHVALNEVLAETPDATVANAVTAPPIKLWLELYNPYQTPTGTTQQQDGYPVPLYVGAPNPNPSGLAAYGPYRIEVWNNSVYAGTPNGAGGFYNDNVLGAGVNLNGATTTPRAFVDVTSPNMDFAPTGMPSASPANVIGTGTPQGAQTGITGAYVPAPNDPSLGFFLLGPKTVPADGTFRDPFVATTATPAGTVPKDVPVLKTDSLGYNAPDFTAGATNDERTTGVTVLLRRLANPHLPLNTNPTFTPAPSPGNPSPTPQINPLYNPYITVDYMDRVALRDPNAGTAPYASRGKRQPYAGRTNLDTTKTPQTVYALGADSPVADQTTPSPQNVQHKFGAANTPAPLTGVYDWLVHLDRQVISPMELLHVSGYQPHQLTQQFVLSDKASPAAGDKFQHLAPWFDQNASANTSYRLYRLFEFLETNNRGAGNPLAGRHTGKINLNAIWDKEILTALCDPSTSNRFTQADVDAIWTALMGVRSPGTANSQAGLPGPVGFTTTDITNVNTQLGGTPYSATNKPILPLTTGLSPGNTGSPADNQNKNPRGIGDTLLQQAATQPTPQPNPPLRLFESSKNTTATHPYQRYELLTKIYNNVTTRSNVFAVWVTIGFFDYDPVKGQIGAEIGRSEGRNVRHRLFAVVDRSNALAFSTTVAQPGITNIIQPQSQQPGTNQSGSNAFGLQSVQLTTTTVPNDPNAAPFNTLVVNSAANNGVSWAINSKATLTNGQPIVQPLVLVYEPGTTNEETVVAVPVPTPIPKTNPQQYYYQLQAPFTKTHQAGVTVNCYGHPGAPTRYDPRKDPGVVLHYSIID